MLSSRPALPQHTTTQAENVWNNSLQCSVRSWHLAASRSCAENPRGMAGRETALSLKLLGFFPGCAKKEFGFASAPSCCCSHGGPTGRICWQKWSPSLLRLGATGSLHTWRALPSQTNPSVESSLFLEGLEEAEHGDPPGCCKLCVSGG